MTGANAEEDTSGETPGDGRAWIQAATGFNEAMRALRGLFDELPERRIRLAQSSWAYSDLLAEFREVDPKFAETFDRMLKDQVRKEVAVHDRLLSSDERATDEVVAASVINKMTPKLQRLLDDTNNESLKRRFYLYTHRLGSRPSVSDVTYGALLVSACSIFESLLVSLLRLYLRSCGFQNWGYAV